MPSNQPILNIIPGYTAGLPVVSAVYNVSLYLFTIPHFHRPNNQHYEIIPNSQLFFPTRTYTVINCNCSSLLDKDNYFHKGSE